MINLLSPLPHRMRHEDKILRLPTGIVRITNFYIIIIIIIIIIILSNLFKIITVNDINSYSALSLVQYSLSNHIGKVSSLMEPHGLVLPLAICNDITAYSLQNYGIWEKNRRA